MAYLASNKIGYIRESESKKSEKREREPGENAVHAKKERVRTDGDHFSRDFAICVFQFLERKRDKKKQEVRQISFSKAF